MAIDSNSLSLSEYAVMSNNPLIMKITESLLQKMNVMADIPMMTQKVMMANGVRWIDNLPTVTWVPLNTEPTVTKGKPSPWQEQAYLVRNAIDADTMIVNADNNIGDPRGAQINAWLTSFTYDFNDKFFNNNHITGDINAPIGLRYRIDNASQYGVNSDMKIDGGGVVMTTAMTAATANTFVELVQQLLDYMDAPDGDGVVLYMNDLVKRRFEHAVRLMGAGAGFDTTKDAFGRSVTQYKGAKLQDVGRKADQTTRVITSTETAAGVDGSSTFSSIYAAHYGEGYLRGWHYEPLAPKDLGLLNNGVIYRTIFNYACGLWPEHTRCIGRLYNIKVS